MKQKYSANSVFAAAGAGMFFFGIALISLGSVLPLLSSKFSLEGSEVSSVVTFLPAGVLLGSVLFGPVVDRFGYKLLLIISSLITAAGLLLTAIAGSVAVLRLAILLTGFGGGILNGETNTIVSDISDKRNRNSNLSFLAIFFGIGALGVPALMSFLSARFSFETILKATSLFMIAVTSVFIFIRFPAPKQNQGFPIKDGIRLLSQPSLLLLSFALFFQSGMEGLSNNWTTTYLEANSVPPDEALLSLTWMVVGMTAARLVLGFALRKVKSHIIIFTGLAVVIMGVIILVSGIFDHSAGMALLGIGFAPVFPVILGYIGTLYPGLSGTAFSIALFIALLGNTSLNFIMGYIADAFGINAFPFMILVAVVLMAAVIFSSLRKDSLITKIK